MIQDGAPSGNRKRDAILAPLNDRQRAVVTHSSGPLLVVAGPGSGKTRVITHRIAHLVQKGLSPDNILAITFTNKAAGEMRARIEELLGMRTPWISTFHSFCARLLRRHIYRLTPFNTAFSIYDADDSLGLIKECLKSLDIPKSVVTPRWVQGEISRLKNKGIGDPDAIPPSASLQDQVIRKTYARYTKWLQERNALDFDDLLLFLVRLFETQDDLLERYRAQFKEVLIDEYQDTNQVQYRIGNLLAKGHRNICATGDPDQSIYSWRGADIRNILSFERDYPDCQTVRLEQNYRSSASILATANAVISYNTERKEKTLWTENPGGDPVRIYGFASGEEEATEVALLAEHFIEDGWKADEIAIFYRINALSRELEQALILRGVPYTIVGAVEFFGRKEIKDIIAFLRILANPRDRESLKRIINLPPRGIGKATVDRVMERASAESVSALDVIVERALRPEGNQRMQKALDSFAALYSGLAGLPRTPIKPLVQEIIDRIGYVDFLDGADAEERNDRLANISEFVNAAAQYDRRHEEDGSLEGFLEEIALFSPMDRWERREERVNLMTLHSAKGLEFPVVIMPALEERLLPLSRAEDEGPDSLEEERRLFFVGITRAEKKLYITHARSRLRYGSHMPSAPSSFLGELVEAAEPGLIETDSETARALEAGARRSTGFDWETDTDERKGPDEFGVDDWDDEVIDEDPYPPGGRVLHEEYGEGKVLDSRGQGKTRRLTIEFKEAGTKQIVLGYAKLYPLP